MTPKTDTETTDGGLQSATCSPSSDTPETDRLEYEQECNYEVCWEDHSRNLERERNKYLKALRLVLASARPHPMENGQMYHAWEEAKKVLPENAEVSRRDRERQPDTNQPSEHP